MMDMNRIEKENEAFRIVELCRETYETTGELPRVAILDALEALLAVATYR